MCDLIVTSTYKEIKKVIEFSDFNFKKLQNNLFSSKNFDILISGIGIAETVFNLTLILSKKKYDRIINTGIAGSYNKNIELGELVNVKTDCFADFGIDDNGIFLTMKEAGLVNEDFILNSDFSLNNKLSNVNSITVNTASGSNQKINQHINKFNPDIESMEGAAAFYVAKKFKTPVSQLRAISNFVEIRNKKNWNTELAIKILNNFIIDYYI